MSVDSETARDPEFRNGAMNRRLGLTKTQSAKHLKGQGPSDAFKANRAGWDAMNAFMVLKEIDAEVSRHEQDDREGN